MTPQPDRVRKDDSRTQAPSVNLSRRQLLGLLAAGGGSAALSACGSLGFRPAFDGNSIFHETMVEMAWPEIKQAAQAGAIVLLPIGIIEEHGPHMSLAPDIYSTYNWAKMTRRALEAKGIQALIAPPMYWGISPMVRMYPGTFTVREITLRSLLYDIHYSLNEWGFKTVLSFNAHGDSFHNQLVQETIQEAHEKMGMGAYGVYPRGTQVLNETYAIFLGDVPVTENMQKHLDIHAGAFETAQMMAYFPEVVNAKLARTLKPSTEFGPNGYWGDPASFEQISTQEIRQWAEAVTQATVEAIVAFLQKK